VGGSGCWSVEDGPDLVVGLVCPDMLVGPGVGFPRVVCAGVPCSSVGWAPIEFVGVDVPKEFNRLSS